MAKPKRPSLPATPLYPHATVAFYGPDESLATKAVVAVFARAGEAPAAIERWYSTGLDLREDPMVTQQIVAWIKGHGAVHSTLAEEIIGCPHEAGVDYPANETCPLCTFWKNRRRP